MTLTRRSLMALSPGLIALPTALTFAGSAAAADEIMDFGVGNPDAKVVIDEYLSFTCPHCRDFHEEIYPQLKADYIDTGKVRLNYHEVYFDKYGLWGALLARCGGEMRYVGIVDMLLVRMADWAGTDDPAVAIDQLKKIGLIAGVDEGTADACLKDQAMAQALIAHYQASVAAAFPNDSFQGTPSFIINGTARGNMSYQDLKAILDAELAK
jgi:protein-disulfide isomerase